MPRKRKKNKRKKGENPSTEKIEVEVLEAAPGHYADSDRRDEEFEAAFSVQNRAGSDAICDRAELLFTRRWKSWRAQRRIYVNKWDYCWRLYNNKPAEIRYLREHGAHVWVPLPQQIVHTIAPRYSQALLGSQQWFDILPREDSDKRGAKMLRHLMEWNSHFWDWRTTADRGFLTAAIFGNVIASPEWDVVERWVRRNTADEKEEVTDATGLVIDRKSKLVETEREKVTYEGVRWRPVNNLNFYMDLDDLNVQLAGNGCGECVSISIEELRRGERRGRFKNVEKVIEGIETPKHLGEPEQWAQWDRDWYDTQWRQRRGLTADVATGDFHVADAPVEPFRKQDDAEEAPTEFVIHRYYGPFDLDGDGNRVEALVEMIGPYCIAAFENPWDHGMRPYVIGSVNPRPDYWPAFGVIEPNIPQFVEYVEYENLKLDIAALICRPTALVEQSAGIKSGTFMTAPGAVIQCINKDGIEWMDRPPGLEGATQIQDQILNQIRTTAGVPPVIQGWHDTGVRTGTETTTLQQEANVRFASDILRLEREFLKPLLEMSAGLLQQFTTEQQTIRVLGSEGYEWFDMKPEDIAGQYDYSPIGAQTHTTLGSLRIQQMQNLAEMMLKVLQAAPHLAQKIDFHALLRAIGEQQEIPGLDRIIPPPSDEMPISPWEEIRLIADGNRVEPKPNDPHQAYLALYYEVIAKVKASDPEVVRWWTAETWAEFLRTKDEREILFQRKQAEQAQQGLAPPEGSAEPPGAPSGGGPPGMGATPPQEQPRSPEAIIRSQGQAAYANPMASGRHEGFG